MAVAKEQEMKAYTQEMKPRWWRQSDVPSRDCVEAFRSGHLEVMDYYSLKNIQADTEMRDAISKAGWLQCLRRP